MIPSFTRLVRFVPASDPTRVCIGEPESADVDVGLALWRGETISTLVWSGKSVLSPGTTTNQREAIGRLLSPLAAEEVGTIRCIGLNVGQISEFIAYRLTSVSMCNTPRSSTSTFRGYPRCSCRFPFRISPGNQLTDIQKAKYRNWRSMACPNSVAKAYAGN